ncbi:uncharacterized protein LOC144579629 [Callithrix jacchus]
MTQGGEQPRALVQGKVAADLGLGTHQGHTPHGLQLRPAQPVWTSLLGCWMLSRGYRGTLCRHRTLGNWEASVCVDFLGRTSWYGPGGEDWRDPRLRLHAPGIVVHCLAMVVTQLNLMFCFQGKKLRGFSCELTRSSHGVLPESFFTIMCQVVVPILLSGLGMMMAGLVMNTIQQWPVFVEVKDLLTLVPPLVGLKGILEMTLASRLSTAAGVQ